MTLYSTTPEARIKELYGELSELRAQLAQAAEREAALRAKVILWSRLLPITESVGALSRKGNSP